MTKSKQLLNHTFDKVQDKVYVTIDNKRLQVKEKFSLSSIYNEINLFKRLNNGKN